jgi:nicotinate-nucleotide adenylyltransferase
MITAGRIGLLGGTFDPIHVGHLAVADAACAALTLDQVLLLPSLVPPHRPQPLASAYHRFAMTALAIPDRDRFMASDLELASPGPSYTSATLGRLHALGYEPWQLFFIAGADAFAEIATWRDYPRLLQQASFVVVNRAGRAAASLRETLPSLAQRMRLLAPEERLDSAGSGDPAIFLVDRPTPEVSSTLVRERCAAGASIAGLVPALVERHLRQHRLYSVESERARPAGRHPAAILLHEQEHH